MFLTVHATAGAAVGALTGNPIAGFLLGVLSHAVLDIIPHGDEALGPQCPGGTCTHREENHFMLRLGVVDGIIMLAVLVMLLRPWVALPSLPVLMGIIGGVVPDVLQGVGRIRPNWRFFAWFLRLHDAIHVRVIAFETPIVLGMLTQLAALTFVAGAYVAIA